MLFSQLLNNHRIFKQLAKALIRLRVCARWSEPLLVAHTTLLEISCCGSNDHELGADPDEMPPYVCIQKAKGF